MNYLRQAKRIPRTEAGYRVTDGNIAAIDFGTTSVSLAYTTTGDKEVSTYKFGREAHSTRVPNAILLKKNGLNVKVDSFGSAAWIKFVSIVPSQYGEYIYFERIKMLLKREKTINRQMRVESFSGEKFYLVEVIAFILKYLKDELLDDLSRTVKPMKTTDFDWVITVPAIWDARGKRMMREAAYLAGLLTESGGITRFSQVSGSPFPLPSEVNPDKLSLALEPESAALYSQEIVGGQIEGDKYRAAISRPKEYMVIDIGGGTVDITVHVEVGGGIQVDNIPTGNAWGGTQVNEAFSKMLQDLVNDPAFSKFLASADRSKNMAIINKIIYAEFEDQKISFGNGMLSDGRITVDLPRKFAKYFDDALENAAGSNKKEGIEYEDDMLRLSKQVVERQLFGPALDGIIKCTLDAIKENDYKVNTFYLVGGFGGCKYVHEKVTAAIEKAYMFKFRSCHVFIPKSPQLAVAQGAAMWRKNPEKIKARKSDATYGIDVIITFDADKHDEYYKKYSEEQKEYKCHDVFNVFLEKGELVKADEVMTASITPVKQSMTNMLFEIYTTPKLGVKYVKDKNGKSTVTEIGRLVIDIPNPDNLPREDRIVDITMDFSGTEIQAKAKYRVNGKEVKTVCDFLSAQYSA